MIQWILSLLMTKRTEAMGPTWVVSIFPSATPNLLKSTIEKLIFRQQEIQNPRQ